MELALDSYRLSHGNPWKVNRSIFIFCYIFIFYFRYDICFTLQIFLYFSLYFFTFVSHIITYFYLLIFIILWYHFYSYYHILLFELYSSNKSSYLAMRKAFTCRTFMIHMRIQKGSGLVLQVSNYYLCPTLACLSREGGISLVDITF